MKTITATKFRKRSKAPYDEVCTHNPVLITSDDRPDIVMVLANDYEEMAIKARCYNTVKTQRDEAEVKVVLLSDELDKFKWISVDDRLPINNAREMKFNYETLDVIVISDGLVGFCEFAAGKTIEFWCEFQDKNVTHWMPLPSPPTNN